ncbi:hypothetical protein EJ110_NYTH14636, partial [Nymphaea thermarum]
DSDTKIKQNISANQFRRKVRWTVQEPTRWLFICTTSYLNVFAWVKVLGVQRASTSWLDVVGEPTFGMAVMLSDEEERNLVMMKVMFTVVIIVSRLLTQPRRIVHPFRNVGLRFVDNIINGHPRNRLDLMCMDRNSFITLCNMLKEKNLIEDGWEISVEEQVAIFLLTIGHNERNRACQNTFQHSGQTISKYVNIILGALCQLGMEYISRPNNETPSKIHLNPRFNPYFKDCLGAIDGTHIPVWVHTSE